MTEPNITESGLASPGESNRQPIWWQIFLPDRGGWFFVYLLAILLFIRPLLLLWDGGTCRHFLNGLYMLEQHKLPLTNYTSAIFPDIPCFIRCWLGDLFMGIAYQSFQLNGLVLLSSVAILLGIMWAYQIGRQRGLGMLSGLLLMVVVLTVVSMHWSARCHIFSYLPFLALYYFVFVDNQKPWRNAAAIAIIMCLWVNLHGSYPIGIFMLAIKVMADAGKIIASGIQNWPVINQAKNRHHSKDRSSVVIDEDSNLVSEIASPIRQMLNDTTHVFVSACWLLSGIVGTFINPVGPALYSDVFGYLVHPHIVHLTDEWRSFDLGAGVSSWAFLLLSLIVIAIPLTIRFLPDAGELSVMLLLMLGGFYSMRLIPYFALLAMPFLGPAWKALSAKMQTKPNLEAPSLISKMFLIEDKAIKQEKSSLKQSCLFVLVSAVISLIFLLVPTFHVFDFDGKRMPVAAVSYMREHNVSGLGFNYDNWGGYLYYKLGKPVFIDDWSDVLPVDFVDNYLKALFAKPDWQNSFYKYNFRWVLIPKASPLAKALALSGQWRIAIQDNLSVLFVR